MPPRKRSSRHTQPYRTCTALGVAGVAVLALSGGTAMAAKGGGAAPRGGAMYVAEPKISKVSCLRRCAARRRAQPGSTLKILGKALSEVTAVTFHGAPGTGDDVRVRVRSGSSRRVHAEVPMGAMSGPISAVGRGGVTSRRSRPVAILPPPPPEPNPRLSPVPGPRESGAPRLETGTSRTKAFYGAKGMVSFSYRISGPSASTVQVELVRASDGAVVKRWAPDAEADAIERVRWNGQVGGKPARAGRYSFRLTAAGESGATARSAGTKDVRRDAFDLYPGIFPVRGPHDYGTATNRFGDSRGGRGHKGHDLFAKCGTRMVAARGGRVKFSGYHSAAGNYIVIDGAGTGTDYVYMHMLEPSPFRTGDRVYTGQRIGLIGETGNASGCHVHFEMWSAPGWYDGGRPFDPYPSMKAWDSWS